MNMVFSGVAGSRPARGLSPNRWRRQTHGQGAQTSISQATSGDYDKPSTSSSLKSPGTIVTGIGNEPTVLAMVEMIGPGHAAPGLAASTSIARSTSLSLT